MKTGEFTMLNKKIKVGVLASTGSVGQRFIQLLADHPWFELAAVSGSEKREGCKYGETCKWLLPGDIPEKVRDMVMLPSTPEDLDVPLVFSALPADVAREQEPEFAKAGVAVCTNAGAFRKAEDVPVLLPEVNPEHTALVRQQQAERGWSGFIVTNPNCTSTGTTIALKALDNCFGLSKVFAVSMQALSGAGYPGVASMDIMDNVVPFISGEEEKFEWEPRKMLGTVSGNAVKLADFVMSTHTNRVPVTDGHLVCLTLELRNKPASIDAVKESLRSFQVPEISSGLPSTPAPVILVREEDNRPQPKLDRMTGSGMSTVVGRVRHDPILDVRLLVLSHNTVRGAAGGSIYNAELLVRQGLI